jgi:Glyoxalase-like domain
MGRSRLRSWSDVIVLPEPIVPVGGELASSLDAELVLRGLHAGDSLATCDFAASVSDLDLVALIDGPAQRCTAPVVSEVHRSIGTRHSQGRQTALPLRARRQDLRPPSRAAEERDAEIERLVTLGARRVDIGQTGNESWTVLADPEGNEFCVVRAKTTLIN